MDAPTLLVAQSDGVLRLTLNRPEKRNALSVAMYDALRTRLLAAADDEQVRVVLLAGADNSFCAGNDIGGFAAVRALPPEQRPGFRFMRTFAAFPKPVVAAVAGDAIGIGATLLLHCDLVYAAEHARLRFPFVDVGLVPEFAASLLLPRLAGQARAAELLMLGNYCSAAQAQSFGLVSQVLPAAALVAHAEQVAQTLAAKPASALLASKRLLKEAVLQDVLRVMDNEMQELNRRLDSAETQAILGVLLKKPAIPKRV